MGEEILKQIEKDLKKKFINSTVNVVQVNHDYADFEITKNKKNVSGKIKVGDKKVHIEEVTSNYNKKYLKTIINNGLKEDIPFVYSLKIFTQGDYIYLAENKTYLNNISNFSYYGYNDTIDCRERICNQTLAVIFLGVVQLLCKGNTPANLAKYRII